MELPIEVRTFEELAELSKPLHLAIGVFDGVHLGHKAVIESAVFSAQRSGGVSAVLTFDPHPSRLFRPDEPTLLLMPIGDKAAMLHEIGVQIVICKTFDREYAAIPAERFLAHLKSALPTLRSISVGENFRFGRKRLGDVTTLVESGRALDLNVFSVDRVKFNGQPISSTRIRSDLRTGAIESVNALLGYNYITRGCVAGGQRLGRQIGFPTLNLPWEPECVPAFGVYRVRFRALGSSEWSAGVANYGVRPTVSGGQASPVLEVHGFEATTLDTGAEIEVEWLNFLREEKRFESLDALTAQIERDVNTARKLAEYGRASH